MTIRWYIAREILLAFAVSFLFFFFIFFLNQILLLAEELLKRKAPAEEVLLLLTYSLPAILALTAPFASLLGILLSIGRLAGDREILASQASGIPHRTLFLPALLLGGLFAAGSFFANDVLLPAGTVNFGKVYRNLLLSTPELELGAYSVKFYKNLLIVTGAVDGKTFRGVSVLDKTSRDDSRLLTAKTARLTENPALPGVITLHLEDVTGVTPDSRRTGVYDSFRAKTLEYNIVLKDLAPSIQSLGPREMPSYELSRQIQLKEKDFQAQLDELARGREVLRNRLTAGYWNSLGTDEALRQTLVDLASRLTELDRRDPTDRQLQSWKTELYQKYSIPLACICFVFLAFPLAVLQNRRGMTGIIGIGLLTAVLYWGSLLGARTLSMEWRWTPEIAMFLPNILILVLSIPVFVRMRR
ncbi:MAG: LptF/LptG family permease [Spirochaetales bacterium]